MGGVSKQDKDQQRRLADQQNQVSQEQLALAREDRARRDEYQAPLIRQLNAITGGDRDEAVAASAIPLGEIAKSYKATREQIINSLPAGAAREAALANLERERPAAQATLLNQQYYQGLDKLANVGSGLGAFSLQELAAGMKAGELSGNTRNQIMQRDAEAKAATLGFLGSLAGGVAGAASGGMWAKKQPSGGFSSLGGNL